MIEASSPGKMILFGEHAVVYGQPAIAAPLLGLRARARIEALEAGPTAGIWVKAPGVGHNGWLHEIDAGDLTAQALRRSLELLDRIDFPPFRLEIQADIPPASGLGSSAATSVAILRVMAKHFELEVSDQTISSHAYELEKIHHGTPSGIDNTVVSLAKPIYFRKESPPQTLEIPGSVRIVIADSGVPSPTGRAVSQVRHSWEGERDRFEGLFKRVGAVVDRARRALEGDELPALGELMDQNQALLAEIGVSSPDLERLIAAAKAAGARGAKLSGAGLGGNVIALAEEHTRNPIERGFRQAGARWTLQTEVRS